MLNFKELQRRMEHPVYSIERGAYLPYDKSTELEYGFYRLCDLGAEFDLHLYQIRFFLSEGLSTVDGIDYPVSCNDVHIVKPGSRCEQVSAAMLGYVFIFSEEFLTRLEVINRSSLRYLISMHAIPSIVRLHPALTAKIRSYIDLIAEEIESNGNPDAIEKMISIVFFYLLDCKQLNHSADRYNLEKVCCLLTQIDRDFAEHQKASYYSGKLIISEKKLNELTKKNIGKTVSQLILDRIMVEAKREILLGRKSIKEIAFSLGYTDNAYFSRVFKRVNGVSALAYKQSRGNKSNSNGE